MGKDDIVPGFDDDTSDSLRIGLQKVPGFDHCLEMRLEGQIDSTSSLFFQRSVRKAIDAGFFNLIFQLHGVDYMSSIGVGAFVQLRKTAREKGGDIAMVDIHPRVMEIFKLMCLDKFFSCTDTVEEAVAPMKNRGRVVTFPLSLKCPICTKRLAASRSGRF